jgi:alpha-glucosidase
LGGSPEARARLLLALLLALPGAACLYQGEELALPEAEVPFELLQDPYGKTMWPEYKGRDGCRTPMVWSDDANGGFSQGTPWLPVEPAHLPLAVAQQEGQADSVLASFRQLLEWRRAHAALRLGTLQLLPAHEQVLAFTRQHGDATLLCVFNLSDAPASYVAEQPGLLQEVGGHGFASRLIGGQLELAPLQAFFAYVGAPA